MPWQELSPLAAGVGAATGWFEGRKEKAATDLANRRQAALDAQTAALTAAQIGNYQSEAGSRAINDRINQQSIIVHPGEKDPLTGQVSKFGNAAYQQAIASIKKGTLDAQTAAIKAKTAAIDAQFKPVMDALDLQYKQGQIGEQQYKTASAKVAAQYAAALAQATVAERQTATAEHQASIGHIDAETAHVGQGNSWIDKVMEHAGNRAIDNAMPTPAKPAGTTTFQERWASFMKMTPAQQKQALNQGLFTPNELLQIQKMSGS